MTSSNIKNFMRKFNVSKPTDMPDIPEEKFGPDGRPISMLSQRAKGDDKRGSVTSNVSELSTATTQVGAGLGIKTADSKLAPPEELISIPEDVQTATAFGPNNEYKAVPSVIEYSTSRGRSRVSIREATPEEAKQAAGSQMPMITDIPELSHLSNATGMAPNVPRIAPPANFQPVLSTDAEGVTEVSHPALSSHPTRQPRASVADSMRTSTTSIRTSTTSDPRTSMATTEGDVMSERGSMASTLNAPGSPPERIGMSPDDHSKEFSEKPPSSAGSWPLHHGSGNGSPRSRGHSSLDTSRGGTAPSLPDSYDASQSRFSWHVTKQERVGNWFTRWFIEWWAMEILSWLFSAVCMMVIIIVLWKVDGKPMPRWRLGVSINAFISIFSGFAKSALLLPTAEALGQLKWSWFTKREKKMMDFEVLDSASRGPMGSLMLLATTKGITLASVGAAIILLSLPLDLFFQQIVAYPSVAIVDDSVNATISRAIVYDPSPETQWRGGDWGIPWDSQLDAFIYPYWLGRGVTPGVEFDCLTGNCTYDPFYTLAADFQCTEMSPEILQFDCKNTSAEWLSTVAYQPPGSNPNVTSCGWYLDVPGNMPQLMSGYEVEPDGQIGEVLATRFFALTDVWTNRKWFDTGSINFQNISIPIVDFILVSTPGGFDGAAQNVTPVVTECEVHWTVKQLQASVDNGVLSETVLETHQFTSDLESPWDGETATYLANYSMTLPDPFSVTGPESTFGLDNTTAYKVWDVWMQIAPSSFTRPSPRNPVESGPILKIYWTYATPHLVQVYDPVLPWDFPANVTDHLGQAVNNMNQQIRRNTLSQRHRHDVSIGIASRNVVLVDIRWQWITLPVALLVFALIFLASTIWKSSKDKAQIGVWKTSALAILFNGLGDDVQGFVGAGNKPQGYVRRKARDIKVQLDDD